MLPFFKKYKLFILAAVVIIAALVIAFVSGGNVEQAKQAAHTKKAQSVSTADSAYSTAPNITATGQAESKPQKQSAAAVPTTAAKTSQPVATQHVTEPSAAVQSTSPVKSNTAAGAAQPKKVQDKYKTDPTPTDKPQPVEPQTRKITNNRRRCTISISCATVMDNQDKIDENILAVQPKDGWILKPVTVTIKEGESVFDVLKTICKRKNIMMEFSDTPMYNSAYIEGINNLYEFDCGSGSGWMYKVNDWYPNYGCSRYAVQNGDKIEWVYTCNMGYDIGGGNQYN